MKLRNKINRQKRLRPIIKWLKFQVRPTYTKVLYKQIINELHSTNRVRIYMNSYYDVKHSFKHGIEAYHDSYGAEFNIKLLEQTFYITGMYLEFKFENYSDVAFTKYEDEDGQYFEIKILK